MADIEAIVEALNGPPFNLDLSLVSFSRKSPQELRQLLNDVLVVIDPKQARDLRDEPREEGMMRMVEFVRSIKYRPAVDGPTFRQGLALGNTDVIYPLLHWMLPQIPLLQKRAYLALFLTDVGVPEELLADDEVAELHALCRGLQDQFKDTHRQVENYRRSKRDPAMMAEGVKELDNEREQLTTKIGKTKTKLQAVPKLDELLAVAVQLRRALDEESQMAGAIGDQEEVLELALAKLARVQERLRDVRVSAMSGSSAALVQQLEEEVSLNRYNVHEKLPKEMERLSERLENIRTILAQPVGTEADLMALQDEYYATSAQVTDMMEQRGRGRVGAMGVESLSREGGGGSDGGGGALKELMYRQQAQLAKQKEQAYARLGSLMDAKKGLLAQIEAKTRGEDEARGRQLRGEDLRRYTEAVKARQVSYARMKREVGELAAEQGVLARTTQLLQQEEEEIKEVLSEAERQGLLAGLEEAAAKTLEDRLGQVQKGGSVDDIERFIHDMDVRIQDHKKKLAPKVRGLRAVRSEGQDLEAEHAEKKKIFDDLRLMLESHQSKLEAVVKATEDECATKESLYHTTIGTARILDVTVQRVMEEQGAGGKGMTSLSDKYRAHINLQEDLMKTLRERQRKAKEMEGPNQAQMSLLNDLRALIQLKLRMYTPGGAGGGAREDAVGNRAVEICERGGANRLVITNDG